MKLFEKISRWLITFLVIIVLSLTLNSCSDRIEAITPFEKEFKPLAKQEGSLAEVSTPKVIQELEKTLQQYQPQVKLISPQPGETFDETTIKVKLQVQDFPLFKNEEKDMGPHLHLILDNEPYQAIYNIDQPIILEDLKPGTHTLRVFPVKPWHESFKNNGAYAQSTFNILTTTEDNNPNPNLPLLTYSRPKESYGAEPIMLDFYLANAPLHLVAEEDSEDDIADWRVKVTINGQSFLLDTWQPVYLKGFKKGKNWVKLEFIDETGNEVKNVFNNTVRLIKYEPNGEDTLSKMVRGELSAEQLTDVIDPNYIPIIEIPEAEIKSEVKSEITPEEIEVETSDELEDVSSEIIEIPQETEGEESDELEDISSEIIEIPQETEVEELDELEDISSEIIEIPQETEVKVLDELEDVSPEIIEISEETEVETLDELEEISTEDIELSPELEEVDSLQIETSIDEDTQDTSVEEIIQNEENLENLDEENIEELLEDNNLSVTEEDKEVIETSENENEEKIDFVTKVINLWNNLLQKIN